MRVLSTSVRGLEMPVDECPSCARGACPFCARGPPCVFVYCTCTTNLYYSTVGHKKNDDDHHHHHHEPRTKFHLDRKDLSVFGHYTCS